VGPWLALSVLALIGFEAAPGAASSESGLLGLKLLFVFGPAAGFVLAGLVAWNHPLDEARHRELRSDLERARGGTR
jgi:Na+/melibiose symporter-like transporter